MPNVGGDVKNITNNEKYLRKVTSHVFNLFENIMQDEMCYFEV